MIASYRATGGRPAPRSAHACLGSSPFRSNWVSTHPPKGTGNLAAFDTCRDGWTGTGTNTYTASFGGTSGASPIITGAALIMQSWRVGRGEGRYSPDALRALLSDPNLNTASANPNTDRIGVMPNLRAIIRRQSRFWWFPYLAWAWLIIIGGLLITPGGTFCIKCGVQDPGYIGDVVVNLLGVVSIVLGIAGLSSLARMTRSGIRG